MQVSITQRLNSTRLLSSQHIRFTHAVVAAVVRHGGRKKSLKATQDGFPCIGLTGVDCWHMRKSSALLPDLDRIQWTGRVAYIVFDSDLAKNETSAENATLLADQLGRRGAKVKVVYLPPGTNGDKVGLDDFLVANGKSAFFKLLESAEEPIAANPDELRQPAKDMDAATEAAALLEKSKHDGHSPHSVLA